MDEKEQGEPFKVLFVDDEENVLHSLARALDDEGYDTLTATSGHEGIEILKASDIAVVISDQNMPVMTGAEFLEHVRRMSPDTVRIVLTGHADIGAAMEAINRGGTHQYLTKPWNDEELSQSVRAAVDRYRLVRENRYLTEQVNRQNEELKKWNAELAVRVQQQTIDLTNNFRDLTVTIANLIELRDLTIANHSNNVSCLSREIAKQTGLGAEEIERIALAAELHDIGKIGMADTTLTKDLDRLAPNEMHEYRKHPVRGQAAIDANEALRAAGSLIRSHHESFNGEGFPDGLRGEEIPLGSRIIAIADAYERFLRRRTAGGALEEVRISLGKQFDPDLYGPLTKVAEEKRVSLSADFGAETEVSPDKLMSGMVLSRELRTGTGILLLSRGATLDVRRIELIKRYFHVDPPDTEGIFVV